ncbi:MAG: TonB-dependent receptor [Bacteroidales bacterium]|nr:TonB-dependent receptor [Bacteroidales bacterium]
MNRIKTLCASFVLSCIMGVSVSAQGGYEVKGVVVDAIGPVIGATVIEQGTSNGTSTGLDGDYVLTVSSANAVVEVSCIGYATQTFVASQLPKTVTLSEDTTFLDEVVVIGYGTVKKEDMTGSITAIKSEELNRGAMVNTQDMLKGKVPGLLITPGDGGPGSGSTIRIRGAASLNASNDPLIIIDGVPIASDAGKGMANPLDMINPNDIESFTILKDASSAAIYGSRASNGVILITTKKGKGNKPQVSYSGSMSVQQNSKRLPVMRPAEFREFVTETFTQEAYPLHYAVVQKRLGEKDVDYQDLVFKTAISHDHSVSVNGNVKDRMPYRASIGYTDQAGTLIGSTYDRGTADLSLNPNFLDKHLTLNLNAKGVYSYSNYTDGGVVGNAAFYNPTQDPYFRNADGTVNKDICNGYFNYGSYNEENGVFAGNSVLGVGPMSLLYDNWSNAKTGRFIGSAGLEYKVHGLEALKFNVNASIDWSESNSMSGVNPGSFQAWGDSENPGVGQYSKGYEQRKSSALEAYANYNETWGIHNLDVMAGYSWQHFFGMSNSKSYFNVTDELKPLESGYPWWKWESYLVSFYGRVNYSIASKYLFTASLRTDGSSRFAPANRWGIFPSGAFAWNIKEEGFLKGVKAVSQLKFRLSAGVTGQQDGIAEYAHLARYSLSTDSYHRYPMGMINGEQNYQFVYTPAAYDPGIKWETTTTYNVGVDFGFLGDRITGNIDAYLRNTNDLLNSVQTPMGSNFGNTILTNIGSMQNKGVEFAVNFIPVQTNDWHLSIGVNGTFQNTKFTKLNATDDADFYMDASSLPGTGRVLGRHQVGNAPYSYYVYQQLYDAEGMPIQNAFVDRNGDGSINDADRYCAGDPNPDFYYGLNVKLSYKNWDFGFNGHGNVGYTVYNAFGAMNSTTYFDANQGHLPNFAQVVKQTGFTAVNDTYQYMTDLFIEDASFFRMDDINLGYTFKEIGSWGGNIRVAASCQNVFVLTGFKGVDPETNNTSGINNSFWPRPRTFSLRLNVNF